MSHANRDYSGASQDRLFDPEKVLPARPTITNIQWISGTQYVSPADMDILSKYNDPRTDTPKL